MILKHTTCTSIPLRSSSVKRELAHTIDVILNHTTCTSIPLRSSSVNTELAHTIDVILKHTTCTIYTLTIILCENRVCSHHRRDTENTLRVHLYPYDHLVVKTEFAHTIDVILKHTTCTSIPLRSSCVKTEFALLLLFFGRMLSSKANRNRTAIALDRNSNIDPTSGMKP